MVQMPARQGPPGHPKRDSRMSHKERETTTEEQRMWRDHEMVFQRLLELSPSASSAAFHLAHTPIRVLAGRTMAAAIRDGDVDHVLRYLQTISGGANG